MNSFGLARLVIPPRSAVPMPPSLPQAWSAWVRRHPKHWIFWFRHWGPGGLVALSFNDPTLEDGRYEAQLQEQVAGGTVEILFREHGPHLDDMNMGSDVIVLKRL